MKTLTSAVLIVLALVASLPTAAAADKIALTIVVKMEARHAVDAMDTLAALDNPADVLIEPMIASRGLYRMQSSYEVKVDNKGKAKLDGEAKEWVKLVEKAKETAWVEVDVASAVDDDRFHVWSDHEPLPALDAIGADQPALASLDLAAVHSVATGAGMRVAVLDTGVELGHPLLHGHLAPGYDLIDDDNDPSEAADGIDNDGDGRIDEAHGHGTFVAGLIAQVAPEAQIVPLRVLNADGHADLYAIIEAIDLAVEMDVDVINMSFGLRSKHESKMLDESLKAAAKAGVLIVAAAGNSNQKDKRWPAAHKNVLSVAALQSDGSELASFSNHGAWVQLAAPGTDLVSSVPGGGYATWGGTSVATPIVAGLAAVALEYAPREKPEKVAKAFLDGAGKMRHQRRASAGVIDMQATFERLDK